MKRRMFLAAGAGTAALALLPKAFAQRAVPTVVVYKNAGCGCCGEWEKHMRAAGFRVESHSVADVIPMKRKLGVPDALQSCHTATVDGYVLEGHVPAGDVKRLLRERTRTRGLAVPGMPVGSPGMEQGPPQPYSTLAFDESGSRVFARHQLPRE
jgi:hypothetical protein